MSNAALAPSATDALTESFIARWDGTGMAERANYSPFLPELCELLGVDRPEAATGSGGSYRFERGIDHYEHDGSISRAMLEFG